MSNMQPTTKSSKFNFNEEVQKYYITAKLEQFLLNSGNIGIFIKSNKINHQEKNDIVGAPIWSVIDDKLITDLNQHCNEVTTEVVLDEDFVWW